MKLYVLIGIILCFSNISFSQEITDPVSIEIGTTELTLSEPFVISVVLKDAENRPPVIFPEIKGLEKRSKSATSTINTIDGVKIVVQTITQEYFATKPGQYQVPVFFVLINGVKYKGEETMVKFSLASTSAENEDTRTEDYLPDPELNGEDVFLSVQADRKDVYIREGFSLRISLYIAESAPVQMEFYQFNTQLQSILKQLRPANCWEENVGIEEIIKRQVKIKGKSYTEYNMYQAQFFPITLQDVIFPTVSLEMLVTENKAAVNVESTSTRPFRSKVSLIKVKPLPNHPLMDQVAVGKYSLVEKLSSALVYSGESVRYTFRIQGIGNIAAIPTPSIEVNSAFDFYPPEISREIKFSNSKVSGERSFNYFVVPRRDGTFPLSRYFQWIYFDPSTAKYDTLRASKVLQVKGEDYKLGNISLSGASGLYDNLESLDSTRKSFNFKVFFRNVTNAIIVMLIVAMIWVFRK
ncbi:BatD family protein [Dyadobacter psychrotolerans]|uniref:Protein BatD n=1 Tax=Dyadobacter psychrotolerans TaxID=2541721 RepID=A0A4R5DI14_9BACT|nr:BatD family protein [Dyadobacter psychrotolerans]TDE13742.1 hypothetical protein E0F88_17740 [Dyadobacter psychrotolerans]